MTNIPSTITPRRRGRTSDAPAPIVVPAAPANEIDTPPRVLIRLPAIAVAAPAPIVKPIVKPTVKPTGIASAGDAIGRSATPIIEAAPWYARLHEGLGKKLHAPRVQKYLPYATAVIVAVGMFVVMRIHAGKSHPVAADSEAPAWNGGNVLPNSHVGGPTPSGPSNTPSWNTPSWPVTNGTPPGASPSAAGNSPSAYQPPPSYPNAGPSVPPPNPVPPNGAQSNGSGAAAVQNDSVPPMPARNPAWNNPPGSPTADPGVVQGGVASPEYRTAQATDPATIPPGRSPNDPSNAGVARFQGGITGPQQ